MAPRRVTPSTTAGRPSVGAARPRPRPQVAAPARSPAASDIAERPYQSIPSAVTDDAKTQRRSSGRYHAVAQCPSRLRQHRAEHGPADGEREDSAGDRAHGYTARYNAITTPLTTLNHTTAATSRLIEA